jgi:hypothetical protein
MFALPQLLLISFLAFRSDIIVNHFHMLKRQNFRQRIQTEKFDFRDFAFLLLDFSTNAFYEEACGVIVIFLSAQYALLWYSPIFRTIVTSSPVSSFTSRTTVCSTFSPASRLPPGNAQ